MEFKSKALIVVYLMTALLALAMTWIHIPGYMGEGFVNANKLFWRDALFNANSAGKFLTVDILFLAFGCNVWMFIEARRIGVKYVYGYVVVGVVVAISVAFPLFLAAREWRLASLDSSSSRYELKLVDVISLVIIFGASLVAAIVVL